MLTSAIALLRKTIYHALAGDSSSQLAAGFALGMMIGLVPKGNLIALSLCVLLFSLRVNKGLALAAALVFSLVSPWADGVSHTLGAAILYVNPLQPVYACALAMPLGPWVGFHNTVVTGSFTLGLYLAYPVFWLTRFAIDWPLPWMIARIEQHRVRRSAGGMESDTLSRAAA